VIPLWLLGLALLTLYGTIIFMLINRFIKYSFESFVYQLYALEPEPFTSEVEAELKRDIMRRIKEEQK